MISAYEPFLGGALLVFMSLGLDAAAGEFRRVEVFAEMGTLLPPVLPRDGNEGLPSGLCTVEDGTCFTGRARKAAVCLPFVALPEYGGRSEDCDVLAAAPLGRDPFVAGTVRWTFWADPPTSSGAFRFAGGAGDLARLGDD